MSFSALIVVCIGLWVVIFGLISLEERLEDLENEISSSGPEEVTLEVVEQ